MIWKELYLIYRNLVFMMDLVFVQQYFFKGCPLRCEWCANPESQAVSPQVLYNNEKCLHCATCVHTCPKGAIKMEDGLIRIDHKTCDHCMECVKACPGKALTQEGEIKTVEEVVDIWYAGH